MPSSRAFARRAAASGESAKTTTPLTSADEAITTAESFGYPVLLKAAAGGGGKGMRVVRAPSEMAGAFDAARR